MLENKALNSDREHDKLSGKTIIFKFYIMKLVGSFGCFCEIEEEEKKLFENLMKELVGVSYKPLAISKQVVSGMKYLYLCESAVVRPDAESYNTIVTVYKPNKGEPVIIDIKKVELL